MTSIRYDVVSTAIPIGESKVADAVRGCPVRYVLNETAFDQCLIAATDDAKCVAASLPDVRVGHTSMWVEWLEPTGEAAPPRRRAGLLVEAAADGRSGRFFSAWMEGAAGPFHSPAHFIFDFDREISSGLSGYGADPSDPLYEPYDRLLRHASLLADNAWLASLRKAAAPGHFRSLLAQLLRPNLRDLPVLCAFLLMQSLPQVFEARSSDLARLNRTRRAKGAPALLDHIEVFMHTGRRSGQKTAEGARGAPRQHWVRGHLVQRQQKVFWRRSHLRGDLSRGLIRTKTVHVRHSA